MALVWSWEEKVGEWITYNHNNDTKQTLNIYEGNALYIAIWESKEDDTYSLSHFACDKDHLRNCLGRTKGYDRNIYDVNIPNMEVILKIKPTKNMLILAQEMIRANWNCKLTITLAAPPWNEE